jgi:hypothetical protein
MTEKEMEKTEWAKRVYESLTTLRNILFSRAMNPKLVVYIFKSNELETSLWAIVDATDNEEFWLDSFPTKKAAIATCREMKWKIVAKT